MGGTCRSVRDRGSNQGWDGESGRAEESLGWLVNIGEGSMGVGDLVPLAV